MNKTTFTSNQSSPLALSSPPPADNVYDLGLTLFLGVAAVGAMWKLFSAREEFINRVLEKFLTNHVDLVAKQSAQLSTLVELVAKTDEKLDTLLRNTTKP